MRYRKIKKLNKEHVIIKHTLAYQVTIYSHDKQALHIFFFPFIFISWRLITLQYCSGFCHTLT